MSTSLINNKYRITRRIGGGSFGEIYLGVGPNGEKVAVKFEKHGSRCPQLRHEYKVYREIANCHGFCKVHHFGTQDNYNVMVMDLLGPSLEDLFNKCGRRFSLKTVLQLADQMLERVDTFHSRHLIHRDIKPANFVIGTGDNCNVVFCVDFGLSKRYRHPKNLQHIPHRDGRSLTGTPRYASINNHLGIEQSRRDDLESIAYVLIYFLKGTLPWQGLKAKNAQKKYRMIMEKKQQVSIAQLCAGCPSQFGEFLAYARALKFDSKPDIPFLRKLFRDLYHAQGLASSGKLWDWDSAEADQMILSGTDNLNATTGPVILSAGGPGSNDNEGDNNEFDEAVMRNANAKRAVTATSMNPRPGTAGLSSWGFGGGSGGNLGSESKNISQENSHLHDPGNIYEAKPTTTRSAGSLQNKDSENDGGPSRRPHTAHGGRIDATQETPNKSDEENGHMVAGARAMMQYRRARSGQQETTTGGGPPPTATSKWTSGLFSSNSPSTEVPKIPSMMNKQPVMNTTQQSATTRKPLNNPVSTPPAWTGPDPLGRPKSAGVASQQNTTTSSQQRPTVNSAGANTGSSNTGSGGLRMNGMNSNNSGSGNGNVVSSTNNSNSMSYGSLKNRFLSGGPKNNKSSKLFTLSR